MAESPHSAKTIADYFRALARARRLTLGDFIGIGFGVDKPFTSITLRGSSDGEGRSCRWPGPFRKRARIIARNGSDK
jgi:hypothetical protein